MHLSCTRSFPSESCSTIKCIRRILHSQFALLPCCLTNKRVCTSEVQMQFWYWVVNGAQGKAIPRRKQPALLHICLIWTFLLLCYFAISQVHYIAFPYLQCNAWVSLNTHFRSQWVGSSQLFHSVSSSSFPYYRFHSTCLWYMQAPPHNAQCSLLERSPFFTSEKLVRFNSVFTVNTTLFILSSNKNFHWYIWAHWGLYLWSERAVLHSNFGYCCYKSAKQNRIPGQMAECTMYKEAAYHHG